MRTIGLFCGGYSSEFEISMKSSELIFEHLPDEYNVVKIIVTEDQWYGQIDDSKHHFDMNRCEVQMESQAIPIDIAIICIHGNPGENGKVQAFLELKNIPCVNSDFQSSSLSFDKYLCNQYLKAEGILTAKSLSITKGEKYSAQEICNELGLPLFVKPTDSGSSYGISKVYTENDIPKAIEKAFNEGNTIIIESFLDGIELTCAVFKGPEGITALPITQIISENDFFDYDAKYEGKSTEETPANVEQSLSDQIQSLSREIYEKLRLKSIARIDYIVVDDTPYVIEVNTIPGFSDASIVPQMLKCAGIEIKAFWKMLIDEELNTPPSH